MKDDDSKFSTTITSGRLCTKNKQLIKEAYISKFQLSDIEITDPAEAYLRVSQQLVLTTLLFHTTTIVDSTGVRMEQPEPPQTSGTPYKAIVNTFF